MLSSPVVYAADLCRVGIHTSGERAAGSGVCGGCAGPPPSPPATGARDRGGRAAAAEAAQSSRPGPSRLRSVPLPGHRPPPYACWSKSF